MPVSTTCDHSFYCTYVQSSSVSRWNLFRSHCLVVLCESVMLSLSPFMADPPMRPPLRDLPCGLNIIQPLQPYSV